jgi:hypothetical protein
MSEGVEILISADDEASAKFAQVARNAETSVKQIKDVGGKAKASTEFIGTLANLTGNSQLGSFAGQLAGLTDKIGQFSEVSKVGGAGALAFKAGLVAAAGVIAFNVGRAIGNVVFQTDEFERSLERAKNRAKELADETRKIQSRGFSAQKEDIELLDPKDREQAQKKLFSQLANEIEEVSKQAEQGEKKVKAWAGMWKLSGEFKADFEQAKDQLEEDKKRLDVLRQQRDEVADMFSDRTKANEARREEMKAAAEAAQIEQSAIEKSSEYVKSLKLEIEYLKATTEEKVKLDAARNTRGLDTGEAEQLLKERDAIKEKQEAEKKVADDKKRANEEAAKALEDQKKKVEELIKSEQLRLDLKKIELDEGEEAAKVEALKRQGVDEATAQRLAAQDAEIKRREQKPDDSSSSKFGEATTNTASESRLLTRGPSQDNGVALLKSSQDIFKELQEARKEAAQARREAQTKAKQVKLELVS